ncbi:nickel/cobalt efflux transporter [Sulfurospirillum cavolei]|uniref:nickel/cobalt efflux transporter n=1 Tax=Sulfurospirillum cavolei TaxID=366522 RepID=UPI000764C30E|nr:nickel/cobalt efflux transporter [Sulfurospirillum cavolei]
MDITSLISEGANLWILLPSAIVLGALHGLEPGHSKTMMASFIIAIRGSVWQAAMLGVAATISHTAIVWIIALAGLYFGAQYSDSAIEPYLQIASSIIILAIAAWMIRQTYKDQHACLNHCHDDHHHHHDEIFTIETQAGVIELSIFEENQPPKFRIKSDVQSSLAHDKIILQTERKDGSVQSFSFARHGDGLESLEAIPEPHEFIAHLFFTHEGESEHYDVEFVEHHHEHVHEELVGLDITAPGYQDAHELAHANDIRKRFANQEVTNFQILLFGLTGGLIPCPATITVLLLCLHLKKVTMGAVLVLGFSIGLALTLVLTGVIAALSIRYMSKRFSGFGDIVRKAPYFSSAIIVLIGLYIGYEGLSHLG